MRNFFASLFCSVILLCMAGCKSETPVEPTLESEVTKAPPATESGSDRDLQSIATAIEQVAKTRRDGDDAIIEVDLRDAAVAGVIANLSKLPKLRSVLLSGSDVTDQGLAEIGKITGLENLDLRGCAVSDLGVSELAGLARLKSIKFSGKAGQTQVTDAAMATLGKLTSLKVIAIDFLPISDQGIASLSGLVEIKELYMAGAAVSDEVAETLVKFPALAKLRIAGTKFSSQGLAKVAGLVEIVELDISDCPGIDNDALSTIAGFKKLSKLNLYSTAVGDADWGKLAGLGELRWLNIDKTNITDQSMAGLGQLTGLTFLHLGSTKISDAQLEQLKGLSKLQQLIVTRTEVTQAGVDRLQSSLPKTEIQLVYVP